MKSILVFGAGGFIGGCLVRAAVDAGWRATAAAHTHPVNFPGANSQACDITDTSEVARVIDLLRPDAVANLAAAASIDRVENERVTAYRVNVDGAMLIARCCAQRGIRLVHFTTDAVFDGSLPAISEEDRPNPLNYYGYTKAAGDAAVLAEDPQAAVLRVSLALGFPMNSGNSFLAMLKTRMVEGVEVFAPDYEVRTPVDIHTLCAAALETAQNDHYGFLNVGATESIDRYTLTTRLVQRMGFDSHLVRRGGAPLPGRAPRHRNGTMDVRLARRVLRTPMLNMDETIERAVL